MYKSIPISPPFQPNSHSHNYYIRVVQLARLETTCFRQSPPLFASLLLFRVFLPYISSPHSFFNTPLSLSQTSNTFSGPPIKKINFQSGCHLPIQEPTAEVPYTKSSDHIPRFKNYYILQKPPKSQQQLSCPTHYEERTSNIPFTRWIAQRHLNTMSDSCPSKLDDEILLGFSRNN